jgi:hypothetical protein
MGHAAWDDKDDTVVYVSATGWSGSCPPVGTATSSPAGVTLRLAVPGGDGVCTTDARSVTATLSGLGVAPAQLQVVDGAKARTVVVDAGTSGGDATVALPISDWRPGDISMYALIRGTLAVDEHHCAYLANPGSDPTYAVWPAGFTATLSSAGRLTLYDAEGVAVAHSGDALTMGGGYLSLPDSIEPGPCLPEAGSDVAYIQSEVPLPSRAAQDQGLYDTAVRLAREQLEGEEATLTSATMRLGEGTVTNTNVGYECTSGRLLRIKLIGTFPHIVTPVIPQQPGSDPEDTVVHALVITADAESGRACLVGVQTGDVDPPRHAVPLDLDLLTAP